MKTVGIIAEYNPFHKGHEYQIAQLKEKTGADYVMIAMSGDFLQRGVPAIINKYARAKMALCAGADIVFELPSLWAVSSAELFAQAGVKLLSKTGCLDHLGFGAESDDLTALMEIAKVLAAEPEDYQKKLKENLKAGLSFPKARSLALSLPKAKLLDTPNNILAMEYLKALEKFQISSVTPVLIPRKGDAYHEKEANSDFASATAIRNMLQEAVGHDDCISDTSAYEDTSSKDSLFPKETFKNYLPQTSFSVIEEYKRQYPFMAEDDLSPMLFYALFSRAKEENPDIADCSLELWNRICKNLLHYEDFSQFCQLLKSKDLTHTRISRVLLHALLGLTNQDYSFGKTMDYVPYLRVLGFRESAKPLLSSIKKEASVPLITKVADASKYLSPDAYSLFEKDLFASHLYRQLLISKGAKNIPNEYTQQIIIIP